MSSSLQEFLDNPYGKSKREGRELFNQWADKNNAMFTGLIIPNVFGPFGKAFYNSVISTFSYQLINNLEPKIEIDNKLNLIYVGDLINFIIELIEKYGPIAQIIKIEKSLKSNKNYPPRILQIKPRASYTVSELLEKLLSFKEIYYKNSIFPDLSDYFDLCLFNTFRSYISLDYFPRLYKLNPDDRGVYVECAKSLSKGQSSYSTTKSQITRGNHFHLRKVERFAVIEGNASIKLRKYGTNEIKEFVLDGNNPAFVDTPIWFVHNITNIGNSNLITLFWTNEFFDPSDADTYFERV
jgi:UDP-2-acetamido-2,6-beta-L-arabino-hexul-4-ose reductase